MKKNQKIEAVKNTMNLFEIILREYIGEKEWTHNLLVRARTLKSAEKKAHKYARKFWSSSEDNQPVKKNVDGQYEFNGGEIVVELDDVRETTKEQFLEECYQRSLIN
jgi:hypothetical protein